MKDAIQKEFMIASLRRQCEFLNDLVLELESKPELDESTRRLYDEVTERVERNLKKIKELTDDYFESREGHRLPFYFNIHDRFNVKSKKPSITRRRTEK